MIQAVIFDMYETLITHYRSPLYFGAQMAADAGITEEAFQVIWQQTEIARSTGKSVLLQSNLQQNNRKTLCGKTRIFSSSASRNSSYAGTDKGKWAANWGN